jgi:hypothetical protein
MSAASGRFIEVQRASDAKAWFVENVKRENGD